MDPKQNQQVEQPDDRRATIEAAFEQEEAKAKESSTQVEEIKKVAETSETDTTKVVESETKPAEENTESKIKAAPKPESETTSDLEQGDGSERAPQAWKGSLKTKWSSIDPEVRHEVARREREITKVLSETAIARQTATQLQQVVQPFMGRITATGTTPLGAFQELLKADYLLSTAPKIQRAKFMAKLISDYEIDIVELDNALAGKTPADPVESRVEQMLQQRLAPLQQFLTQQQAQEQHRSQEMDTQIAHTIETMSQDPKYPYFEDVRESMADIIEIISKRGQHITIESAYNRAIAMDPEISKRVADTSTAAANAQKAAEQTARAQRALQASASVSGAPGGTISGSPSANDRRATIAAAFDALGGR